MKILDDLEKEVDKATGKKKDWAKVRYTGKQIKDFVFSDEVIETSQKQSAAFMFSLMFGYPLWSWMVIYFKRYDLDKKEV